MTTFIRIIIWLVAIVVLSLGNGLLGGMADGNPDAEGAVLIWSLFSGGVLGVLGVLWITSHLDD